MSQKFLISRLSAMGDVVCTLPAASALKRSFPDCQITWVVDPRFAGIVECCTVVDEIIRAKPKLSPSSWPTVEGEFDVAFDLQGLSKSAVVILRAQAKRKLGYHWQREMAALASQCVLPDPTSFHVVDQYVDVVRAAGAQCDLGEFNLAPKPEDLATVKVKIRGLDGKGRLVILNAGAGWPTKRWPAEHFSTLANELSQQGFATALIGGAAAADKVVADHVLSGCTHGILNLVGQTSVKELVALISLSAAHVGGDTGSTHIAAALGRPAIGLYSITNPKRSCPYGQIDRCLYDPSGLAAIQPRQVLETVLEAVP
jgi:heptosyltransferase I